MARRPGFSWNRLQKDGTRFRAAMEPGSITIANPEILRATVISAFA
jgi:hypothetical protein